jgi:hypothetical protein
MRSMACEIKRLKEFVFSWRSLATMMSAVGTAMIVLLPKTATLKAVSPLKTLW